MEYMSFEKFYKLLLKKWKIILYYVLAFIVLAIMYGLFFYSPTYTSMSKILLKQDTQNTYVAPLTSDSNVYNSLGQNKNPVLTQIEILNSMDLANKVAESLSTDVNFSQFPKEYLAKVINKRIKYENPPGTDVIQLQISWNNPQDAQKISKVVLSAYTKYNEDIYKKSVSSTKEYIETQLKETNKNLDEVRNDIEKYRKENTSVDVNLEAGSIIAQRERVENLLADVNSNVSATQKRVEKLSQNLGIDVQRAVESVALGQSPTLSKLNQDLNDNQQKLASFKVKYPENTPQIKTLESTIKEINSQIQSETLALIGKKTFKTNNSVISDTVRSEMVSDYIKNSVEVNSLRAQQATLKGTLFSLKKVQKELPEIQKTISILQEKEKNLALIAETLNSKLVEAQIKESAIVSNVDIVEAPQLPEKESFPTFIHILAIFIFLGLLLGVATILGLYYVEDVCEGATAVEEAIQAPVLGIIPWLTSNTYGNFLVDYNPHSVVAIIYQKIATSLKVKCYKKKYNAIAIISAELEKRRSIVAASLANTFAKSGDKVFLIDTDFRDGSLTREFNIDFSKFMDITDCIIELSKIKDTEANYIDVISKYVVQIPGQQNLFIIPNNNKIDNPYEILNSDVFPKFMQVLKDNFDMIIVDTPPMLAVADSIITSQFVDGLVVLCGVKTSRSNLRKIRKLCDDNYVEILGAVARDSMTELEVPENMYIKQLSSNS